MFLMYWSKLLNTTCEAIRVEPYGFVTYPIYKNGRTSLWEYATDNNCKTFINFRIFSVTTNNPVDSIGSMKPYDNPIARQFLCQTFSCTPFLMFMCRYSNSSTSFHYTIDLFLLSVL